MMKLKEIELYTPQEREYNAFRIVTRSLLDGQRVTIENITYTLSETNDETPFKVVMVLEDESILGVDFDFAQLFKMTQTLSDGELFSISAGYSLKHLKN